MTRHTYTRSVAATAVAAALALSSSLAGSALADEAPVSLAAVATTVATTDAGRPVTTNNEQDEERIRKLHDRLGITTAQEGLWAQLAQVMRANDEHIDVLAAERHGRAPSMTAVEDLRSYGDITEAHAAGIRAFVPAFANLYESMSSAQKANADNVFRHAETRSARKAKKTG